MRARSLSAALTLLSAWSPCAFAADEGKEEKGRSYAAGDLGLGDLDQPPPSNPKESSSAGIGINATLSPGFFGNRAVALQPNVSLRLWFEQLMLEPVLGVGLVTEEGNTPTRFQISAGMLIGFALAKGNLRPIIGGGMTFALVTGGGTTAGFTFGPMFGLEYRFQELPNLGLDAALFLPMRIQVDPFVFGIGTEGGALLGFHYYFSGG